MRDLYYYSNPPVVEHRQCPKYKIPAKIPIVIDNGSYFCRVGFANMNKPILNFPNIISKNRFKQKQISIGHEIDWNTPVSTIKSPYEGNLLTGLETQEVLFDYIFESLGQENGKIKNPILIKISELLFEIYNVPAISYFVDSLAAHHQNKRSFPPGSKNSLIVTIGYHSCHLVPIFDSQFMIPQAVRRINLGGYNCIYSLQKLLEMKYPCHAEIFNYSFSADILHKFGSFSSNYRIDSTKWKDSKYASDNSQPIQLPFSKVGADEIQAAIDKKHQKVERLREFRRKKLETELKESSEKLKKFEEIAYLLTSDRHSPEIPKRLAELDMEMIENIETEKLSLLEHIEYLNEKLSAMQETKITNSDSNTALTTDDDPFAPEVVGPSQLGPDSTQRFKGRCKLAYEALCSQAIPAAIQAQMITANPNDMGLTESKFQKRKNAAKELEESCNDDYLIWLQSIRNKHARVSKQRQQRMSKLELAAEFGIRQGISSIVDSVDAPQEAQKDSAELTTGRGGAPLTERRRMQLEKIRAMTSELQSNRLPSSTLTPKRNAKKPKSSQSKKGRKSKKEEPETDVLDVEAVDNLAYQEQDEFEEAIEEEPASQSSAEESEEVSSKRRRQSSCTNIPVPRRSHFEILEEDAGTVSENERDQLAIYESLLALYDPNTVKDIASTDYQVNIEDYYTINLETELIRSTEILFHPSLVGREQTGIGSTMDYVFRDATSRLGELEGALESEFWVPEVVLLHGGLSQLPGLSKRMELEIKQRMPFSIDNPNIKPTILLCNDPLLDAWKGAASWADDCIRFGKGFPGMTKLVYEECGTDYFIEHPLSNVYYSK